MNEDFAVFEYVGDGYNQLSVWMTKDRADTFAKTTFIDSDKIIFQRFRVSSDTK